MITTTPSIFYGVLLLSQSQQSNSLISPVRTKIKYSPLFAAPSRLEDNVDGVLYVNSKCINCAACNQFAPQTFDYSPKHHKYVVKKQPPPPSPSSSQNDAKILDEARAALSACPVGAIRVENSAQRRHRGGTELLTPSDEELAKQLALNPTVNRLPLPFPRLLVDDVYHLGHHDAKSFGAVPYLALSSTTSVMVDTPKFSPSAVRAVQSLCGEDGPDYLFLTHVDDVGDHGKWKERFPDLKRIFHSGDLGEHNWIGDDSLEDVEILLQGDGTAKGALKMWTLNGEGVHTDGEYDGDLDDFTIIHTPGHSPGSISLLFRNSKRRGILFTGDTLAYSNRIKRVTGFPRYGNDVKRQAITLEQLLELSSWDFLAPGHGKYRDYSGDVGSLRRDVMGAIEELKHKWL